MKIRSFPISLLILALFSLNLTGCGSLPTSPTSTLPVTQTATLEIPTQTPSPTATPESQLSESVLEKFKIAGIDNIKDMANATYDNKGLHITIEGQGIIDVPDSNLENFVNLGAEHNGKMYGEDHFLPVYDENTELTSIYQYDVNSKSWFISEILSKVDVNDPNSVTARHVFSGALARQLHKLDIEFPEGSVSNGWKAESLDHLGHSRPAPGAKTMELDPFIFNMKGDFLGIENGKFSLIVIPVLNKDGTVGFLNVIGQANVHYNKENILRMIKVSNGTGVGVMRETSTEVSNKFWDNTDVKYGARLYPVQGPQIIEKAVKEMEDTGNITSDTEKLIFNPS